MVSLSSHAPRAPHSPSQYAARHTRAAASYITDTL